MSFRDSQSGQHHAGLGNGHTGISVALSISITQVLNVLKSTTYTIKPRFSPYDCLEGDECWTYGAEQLLDEASDTAGIFIQGALYFVAHILFFF
ncbi:MAG: hypothetical protein LBK43_01410 [Treponema sp.]|jgi:hypothetical protein|nr:hypothetical protein [Treponema sp.]